MDKGEEMKEDAVAMRKDDVMVVIKQQKIISPNQRNLLKITKKIMEKNLYQRIMLKNIQCEQKCNL